MKTFKAIWSIRLNGKPFTMEFNYCHTISIDLNGMNAKRHTKVQLIVKCSAWSTQCYLLNVNLFAVNILKPIHMWSNKIPTGDYQMCSNHINKGPTLQHTNTKYKKQTSFMPGKPNTRLKVSRCFYNDSSIHFGLWNNTLKLDQSWSQFQTFLAIGSDAMATKPATRTVMNVWKRHTILFMTWTKTKTECISLRLLSCSTFRPKL